MDKQELIFKESSANKNDIPFDFSDFIKYHSNVILPKVGDEYIYRNSSLNEHHYTTEFHRQYVIPALKILLGIPYNDNDFYLIEDKRDDGDFSFLMPKVKQYYKIKSIIGKKNDDNKTCDLYVTEKIETSNNIISCDSCVETNPYDVPYTTYHKLFKYAHSCSVIENISNYSNDKTLLISCDSQMIPTIPILTMYYKKVITMDNRLPISMWDLLKIDNEKIDDVLLGLWENNSLNKFIVTNLK